MLHSRRGWSLRRNRTTDLAALDAAPSIRTSGVHMAALLALLTGAWAALCVFIGPYFDYRPTSPGTWDWTTINGMLHLLPGAVAAAAALIALMTIRGRGLLLPGLLIAAAGAWLVLGPAAWPTVGNGQVFENGTSALRAFIDQAGSSLAPGAALALLGGMILKAAISRPVIEQPGVATTGAPMTGTGPRREVIDDRDSVRDRRGVEDRGAVDDTAVVPRARA